MRAASRKMVAALAAVGAALVLAGCPKTRDCKAGTVLLTVDWPAGADALQYVVTVDGTATMPRSVTVPTMTTHGTLELDFASYPAGHPVSVTITALTSGAPLGSASSPARALAKGCDHLALSIAGGGGGDGGSSDGGGADAGNGAGSCASAADCAVGQACDTSNGTCTQSCSATQPCNGGCCDNGTCAPGNTTPACALGAATCGSCAGNGAGSACLDFGGGNVCGCTSASDCPNNQACNSTTHTCGAACDANTPCNGGCCSAASGGTCQTGTLGVACGNNGSLCGDCTSNQIGHRCVTVAGGGQCGCNALAGDCPNTSTACTNGLCVNVCSTSQPCVSGCCSATSNGTCQPGTAQAACGGNGTVCASCAGNANGSACLSSGACGCTKSSDCPVNHACDLSIGRCTSSCTPNQLCNGGCCSNGTCIGGTTTAGCGSAGSSCTVCPSNTACATYSCDGSSCIPSYASSSTICSQADPADCFYAAYCPGNSSTCPARSNACTGHGCCTGVYKCTSPCP